MKKFIIILSVFCFIGCSPKTYTFQGKDVTKRQFDRKLKKFTDKYVNDNPELVELWNGVEVVFDTTKLH